jgi:hypothetical protein
MPQGISIADVSVIHPNSLNTLSRAAATTEAAASQLDRLKQPASASVEQNGYSFVPGYVRRALKVVLYIVGLRYVVFYSCCTAQHGLLKENCYCVCTQNAETQPLVDIYILVSVGYRACGDTAY